MPVGYDPTVKAAAILMEGSVPGGDEAGVIDPYLGDKTDQRKRGILTKDENEFDPEDTSTADVSQMIIPASLQKPADEWVPIGDEAAQAKPKDEWLPVGEAEKPLPPQHPSLLSDIKDAYSQFGETLKEIGLGKAPAAIEELLPEVKRQLIALGATPEQADFEARRLAEKTRRMQMTSNLPTVILSGIAAPLMGLYRNQISRPLEERTGIPKEVIEGLAMIGGAIYGIHEMGPMATAERPPGAAPILTAAKVKNPDNVIVNVDAEAVHTQLRAIDTGGYVPEKLAAAKEFIAGQPEVFNPPELNIRPNTKTGEPVVEIIDGIHRWKAMRDEGLTVVPVEMSPEAAQQAQQMGLVRAPDVPQAPDLKDAENLGIIGPPKPEPAIKDSPSQLAEAAIPHEVNAAVTPKGELDPVLGHQHGEYDVRGKEWIDKIDEPDDVRDVIEKIATDHDYFPEARGGVASEASRLAVAEAAGISPADIDKSHFAANFDNDGKVRAVIQVLRQTTKDFMEASDKAAKDPTPENIAAAAEAELRHQHVLEYTMGLRAESGRSLAAWKDLLREAEHNKAKVALKAGEAAENIPKGVVPVVDAAKDVADNLKDPKAKKLGLQKLVEAAQDLVDKEDKAPPRPAPLAPEIAGLVGEARKALKKLKGDKAAAEEAEVENFRRSLEQLAAGEGKLDDTVEAARALLEKLKKPAKPAVEGEEEAPKVAASKGKLVGAARRLVDAAEAKARVKAPVPEEMQSLMEAARQAVGRLKGQRIQAELEDFRNALNAGDPQNAVAAAKRLLEAGPPKAVAGQPKPPVEFDQIMATARRVAEADLEKMVKEGAAIPPDIKALMAGATKAAAELQAERKLELGKLIDAAEKQAINMTKAKTVKEPVEALPPELQALVDKTRRIVDRFGGIARGERAALFLARTGRTTVEQEQLARSVAGLTPNQVAKVLNKLRTSKLAEKPGWFFWLWQQGLISGLVTHTGYAIVNTATVFAERVLAPTLGATLGKVRGQNVSVMGPLYANVAMVHALPDALAGAAEAFITGNRVPLASEMRLFERGEESPQAKGAAAAYTPPGPNWGIWKKVFNETQLDAAAAGLGVPGRAANLMHTFFKILSERASRSTRAYEEAFQEGAQGDRFWQRYQYHLDNPTDEALVGSVNDAYNGAFMGKLGEKTGEWARTLGRNPITKWAFPFQHIPWNIERMTMEYTPFAVLGPEMRSALLGEKGAPAQNLALAKMAIGSSVIGYFIHKALGGEATGDYPIDAKERRRWQLMRIPPNSIQVGGYWVNLERLGPAGNVAHIGAELGQIIKHYDGQDDKALMKAIMGGVVGAANQVGNEVGFQTLKNLFEAMTGEKKFEQVLSYQAGSFIYPSSLLSQNASFIDPYMRQAKDLTSELKYRIPFLRETLPPKLDPLYGEPVPNPAYHAIKRTSPVETDPVKAELDRLGVYPAAPKDQIGGVKLPPALYDRYQELAGSLTKRFLEQLISNPKWDKMPASMQADKVKDIIQSARETAAKIVQAVPTTGILRQGIQDQRDKINGVKPGKLQPGPFPQINMAPPAGRGGPTPAGLPPVEGLGFRG